MRGVPAARLSDLAMAVQIGRPRLMVRFNEAELETFDAKAFETRAYAERERMMTTDDELAKEMANCRLRLQAMAMWNTAGKSLEELVEAEAARQETLTQMAIAEAKLKRAREEAVAAALAALK
jgi:hypothetical protein